MGKIHETDWDQVIEEIRAAGVFSLPPDHCTTELHIAAFFHLGRRAVTQEVTHRPDGQGVKHKDVGHRQIMVIEDLCAWLQEHGSSPKGPRKGESCTGST